MMTLVQFYLFTEVSSSYSLLLELTFPSFASPRNKPLGDTPFCHSIQDAVAEGPEQQPMIHAFVSNVGHFSFLHNALLSMEKSQLPWTPLVLSIGQGVCPMLLRNSTIARQVICVDYLERLLEQLQRDEPESVHEIQPYLNPNATTLKEQFETIDKSFQTWATVAHKFLINAKLYALRDLLECGVDALITDTDIAFRQDPRPYFVGDLVFQNDTTDQYELSLNSGFMFWKATLQNVNLTNDLISVPPFWHIDQARVNTRLYNQSIPHTVLDAFKFPNGNMLNHYLEEIKDDMVVAHANWNNKWEEKRDMLKKAGLWYL